MTKPSSFILTTDYPTIKNDNSGSFSITIPASQAIATGTAYEQEVTKTIGTASSLLRITAKSSLDGREFSGNSFMSIGYGDITPYGSTPYNIMIDVYRKSSTVIAVHVYIPNLTPVTLTTGAAETITIKVATFLSPFN